MKGYWYKTEVERFLSVGLSVTFAFFPPDFYESDMTEMDESDPPFSACVRVTTRGQTPALILFYLKIPETSGLKKKKKKKFTSHKKLTSSKILSPP